MTGGMHQRERGIAHLDLIAVLQKNVGGIPHTILTEEEGKRIFIETFEQKLASKLVVKGKEYTYRQLMMREVYDYQKSIREDSEYKPYKYY